MEFKDITTGAAAKTKLGEGVNALANAVKVTLGPRGRHAAIQKSSGAPLITKDGVTVAKSINLADPIKNMGAQLIKSVASATNSASGDGTTTATVLAQAIFNEGWKSTTLGVNTVLLKRGIDLATEAVVLELSNISTMITDEVSITNVATISANNDKKLGKMIAEAISAVGEFGFILVEEGAGSETEIIYTEGLIIDRGLLSTDFISNAKTLTCELENSYILCYDDKIDTLLDLSELLQEVANTGKPFLLIAKDYSPEVVAQILYNRLQNKINWCVIKAPGFGDTRREMLRDIAVMTGAKLLHNDHKMKFKGVTISDLGVAKQVSVGLNETKIVEGSGTKEAVQSRVETLESQIKNVEMHEHQKNNIRERISRLTGGVATFRIGGASESEVKEKKDRVEDAINAVRSALTEGVVPGGGAALIHCLPALSKINTQDLLPEEIQGIKVIEKALQAPMLQILENSGKAELFFKISSMLQEHGNKSGYDALKYEFVENMLERGIIDPTKVVRVALEQAASASGTLLTTEVTISVADMDNYER